MSKSEFIRSLRDVNAALGPFEVSQRIREKHSCVSTYMGDPGLNIEHYRGYMVRFSENHVKTPENPELYVCVISTQQPKPWQDLVWTKEILGILDGPDHWTHDKQSLGYMMGDRTPLRSKGTPLNVMSDKNGLTLALGCTVPLAYRRTLRQERYLEKYTSEQLESMLLLPAEFIPTLLSEEFETEFDLALSECDHQKAA